MYFSKSNIRQYQLFFIKIFKAKYDEAALSHGRNETLNFNLNSNSSSYSEISSESNCQDTGAAIAYDSLDSSNIFNLKLQLGNVIKSCILIRKNILNQLDSAKVLQLMDNLDELNIIKSDLVSKILELDVDDESDHDDTDYESYMNTFVNENYSSVNESLNNSIQSFCFDSLLDHSNQFSIFEV